MYNKTAQFSQKIMIKNCHFCWTVFFTEFEKGLFNKIPSETKTNF